MSIEQTNTVDAISVDNNTGYVVLSITDHIAWGSEDDQHLYLLQEKINTYLRFVESGELLDVYPKAKGRTVLIDVVCKHPLNESAAAFYAQVAPIVESAGMKLGTQVFRPKVH